MSFTSPSSSKTKSRSKSNTLTSSTSTSTAASSSASASRVLHGQIIRAETEVSIEYAALNKPGHCPLGMYVVPSMEALLRWSVVLFVHQGYYADAILRFHIIFPPTYPDHPPLVRFTTDVFHPLVSQDNGEFKLDSRFPQWSPSEHRVFHVLHWIKAAFKKEALESLKEEDCSNKEAFKYHDTTSSFVALARQSAMLSQSASALFDADHPTMGSSASIRTLNNPKEKDAAGAVIPKNDIVFTEPKTLKGDKDVQKLRERLRIDVWDKPKS